MQLEHEYPLFTWINRGNTFKINKLILKDRNGTSHVSLKMGYSIGFRSGQQQTSPKNVRKLAHIVFLLEHTQTFGIDSGGTEPDLSLQVAINQ